MTEGVERPDVTLAVEIGDPLERLLDAPTGDALRAEIERALRGLMEAFGIPGPLVTRISALSRTSSRPGEFLRVTVNRDLCRYPDELLLRVYSFVDRRFLGPATDVDSVRAWLKERIADNAAGPDQAIRFIGLACIEIVKSQLNVLLSPGQAATYLASLPTPTVTPAEAWPPTAGRILPALVAALSAGLSLADRPTVSRILAEGLAEERDPKDLAEDLISGLRPEELEIRLPHEYLRQITLDAGDEGLAFFDLLRDGLFYELGLVFPEFRFVPVDDLDAGSFAFRVNHLDTLPRIGLQPKRRLVAATADRLAEFGVKADPALNPANGNECALIDASDRPKTPANLTDWTALGYLVLSMSADLREKSGSFVHSKFVRGQLSRLEWAFPALVKAVYDQASVEQLTRLLRSLAVEGISIRDLPLILEAVLDYDYIVIDPMSYIVLDDRLATAAPPDPTWIEDPVNLTSFVRTGMKRYISHKYTRGQSALRVYLLDPELERWLLGKAAARNGSAGRWLSHDEQDQILGTVGNTVEKAFVYATPPSLLTSAEVRPLVHELLALEFPRMPVLAYQELSPELSVQPIGRIELDELPSSNPRSAPTDAPT